MAVISVHSAGLHGIEAFPVRVEVDVAGGQLPGWQMVGLPESAVKESKDRVLTALRNAGYPTPTQKVTVNLSPANLRKDGTAYDLPIALGLLACEGLLSPEQLADSLFLGELSLHAEVKRAIGVLATALLAHEMGVKRLFVPAENAREAAVVQGIAVYPISGLSELVEHLRAPFISPELRRAEGERTANFVGGDFSEIRGQYHGKRALEIAASGGHNVLLIGPPGSGKSMLCQRLPTILPPLSFAEAIETTKIYSRMGLLKEGEGLLSARPFRAPHHSVSDAGLVGGGSIPRPGEISFAHNGVLFLDELPEFKRHVLELLRQPLEEGRATITRAQGSIEFPARFVLAAAMNPCPCGYLGHPTRGCTCTPLEAKRYQSRLSGPLLDRIDLHIELAALKPEELLSEGGGESSAEICARVSKARECQRARYAGESFEVNAHMRLPHIKKFCPLSGEMKREVLSLLRADKLSARGYHRLLKVARTIADLDGMESIALEHLFEAYQYRHAGIERAG